MKIMKIEVLLGMAFLPFFSYAARLDQDLYTLAQTITHFDNALKPIMRPPMPPPQPIRPTGTPRPPTPPMPVTRPITPPPAPPQGPPSGQMPRPAPGQPNPIVTPQTPRPPQPPITNPPQPIPPRPILGQPPQPSRPPQGQQAPAGSPQTPRPTQPIGHQHPHPHPMPPAGQPQTSRPAQTPGPAQGQQPPAGQPSVATPQPTIVPAVAPITWQNYNLGSMQQPTFSTFTGNRNGHYPSGVKYPTARTAILLFINELKKDASTITAAQQFITATMPLLDPAAAKQGTQQDLTMLLEIVMVLLQAIPLDLPGGYQAASNLIEILVKENEYSPHTVITTFMAPLYINVDALQKEVSQERELRFKIRNHVAEEVEGLGALRPDLKNRDKSIGLLAQNFTQCLSALHFAVNQFNGINTNGYVSKLDKDLCLSSLACNWLKIEKLYTNLSSILAKQSAQEPDHWNIFAHRMLPALTPPNYTAVANMSIAHYFNNSQQRMQTFFAHQGIPSVSLNEVLMHLQASNAPQIEKYFIEAYIPKAPQTIKKNESFQKQYLQRAKNALYSNYKSCNSFDGTVIALLKITNPDLEKDLQKDLEADQQQEKIDQKLEEAQNDIKFVENTEAIKELRHANDELAKAGRKTKKEAEELDKILKFQEEVIDYSTNLKEIFSRDFLTFCERGNLPRTQQRVIDYLYQNPLYTEPVIAGKKITDQKMLDFVRATLMQTTIATLIKHTLAMCIPLGSCDRCTYNAAWLIAEDLLRNYPQHTLEWIKEFYTEFPYAPEGDWYNQQKFNAKYEPQFLNS